MKLLFENWRKFLKEEAIEKLYKALGEDQQKIFKTLTAEQQLDLATEWSQEGMPGGLLNEGMKQAADLPDGVQVRIEDKGGGDIITNLPLCYTAKTIQK